MDYESPELAELPDFGQLLPNVYAMSADPMTIAYNTALMPRRPRPASKSLADIAEADPGKFKDKITVRDPEGSFGFTVTRAFTEANPDGWSDLEQILPLTRPRPRPGTQLEKIVSGEYLAGFFISGGPAFPVVEDSDGLVDVVYPEDGTVVLPRGIGIAADAPHPATAKLFLDFVLSEEGQRAVAEGGLSSYREGVERPRACTPTRSSSRKSVRTRSSSPSTRKVSDAEVDAFTESGTASLGQVEPSDDRSQARHDQP